MNPRQTALYLAAQAHEGQLDRGGAPYLLHPVYVALQCADETGQTVALLHDTIEDSDLTLEDLARAGFSAEVVAAVDALSRRTDESYEEYVVRLCKNPLARRIKRFDLLHNLDRSRLPSFSERDQERFDRYTWALGELDRIEGGASS
ncbi:MAG: HD domain-containing protein [Bacillota bacterium]|nr:HD domain-containing protein [Bacillota bacterium]